MKVSNPTPRYPCLSFKELAVLIPKIEALLLGARINRVFVPELPSHPDRFFKKEWIIDVAGPKTSHQLYLSLRPQACGLILYPSHSFKPFPDASRSGFDLSLNKSVIGSKISSLRLVEGERIVEIELKGSESLTLALHLIPASPFAVLLEAGKLVASTDGKETYQKPQARQLSAEILAKIPFREDLIQNPSQYQQTWEVARLEQALFLKAGRIEKVLKNELQVIQQKIASLQTQADETAKEPDYQYFGTLLQMHYHEKPKPNSNHFYECLDYEKDQTISIPADPKLELKAQMDRFFHLAKRKKKRGEETEQRLLDLKQKETRTNALFQELNLARDATQLNALEQKLGIESEKRKALLPKDEKKLVGFSGLRFRSKEGLSILVGRNSGENTELTFKIAKGNDLWLHVKGRPGSHTVVLLPPKRSASLDTLLDAATLCLLHSGGKEWGKTEVDYTLRKHVKKIKGQVEVSYSQQKTLIVEADENRIKTLYQTST